MSADSRKTQPMDPEATLALVTSPGSDATPLERACALEQLLWQSPEAAYRVLLNELADDDFDERLRLVERAATIGGPLATAAGWLLRRPDYTFWRYDDELDDLLPLTTDVTLMSQGLALLIRCDRVIEVERIRALTELMEMHSPALVWSTIRAWGDDLSWIPSAAEEGRSDGVPLIREVFELLILDQEVPTSVRLEAAIGLTAETDEPEVGYDLLVRMVADRSVELDLRRRAFRWMYSPQGRYANVIDNAVRRSQGLEEYDDDDDAAAVILMSAYRDELLG